VVTAVNQNAGIGLVAQRAVPLLGVATDRAVVPLASGGGGDAVLLELGRDVAWRQPVGVVVEDPAYEYSPLRHDLPLQAFGAQGNPVIIGYPAVTRLSSIVPICPRRVLSAGPAVDANYSLDRTYQGGMAFCLHEAATGREETMPHDIAPAPEPRRATIVGAGPAELEAALAAAGRGHKITVFEASDQPGEQIRLTVQQERHEAAAGCETHQAAALAVSSASRSGLLCLTTQGDCASTSRLTSESWLGESEQPG
jgi:hypothetical protein